MRLMSIVLLAAALAACDGGYFVATHQPVYHPAHTWYFYRDPGVYWCEVHGDYYYLDQGVWRHSPHVDPSYVRGTRVRIEYGGDQPFAHYEVHYDGQTHPPGSPAVVHAWVYHPHDDLYYCTAHGEAFVWTGDTWSYRISYGPAPYTHRYAVEYYGPTPWIHYEDHLRVGRVRHGLDLRPHHRHRRP